jgi:hypothetical protein
MRLCSLLIIPVHEVLLLQSGKSGLGFEGRHEQLARGVILEGGDGRDAVRRPSQLVNVQAVPVPTLQTNKSHVTNQLSLQ